MVQDGVIANPPIEREHDAAVVRSAPLSHPVPETIRPLSQRSRGRSSVTTARRKRPDHCVAAPISEQFVNHSIAPWAAPVSNAVQNSIASFDQTRLGITA